MIVLLCSSSSTMYYLLNFLSLSKTFWKRSNSLATTPLKARRHIRFGIAISALAMSENVHAISSDVVAPTKAINEKKMRYIILYLCVPKRYSNAFSP